MAYVEYRFTAKQGKGPMKHYCNLTAGVGPKQPNRPDDVALVQYFLKSFYDDPEFPLSGENIEVDGVYGPTTSRAIHAFQELAAKVLGKSGQAEGLAEDGIVDRARGIFGQHRSMYTIIAMNKMYAHRRWNDYRLLWPMIEIREMLAPQGLTA